MTPKYSDLPDVDQAMHGLIACLHGNPYAEPPRIGVGNMTVPGMIEKIRERFGDSAARSVKVTLH